MQVTHASVPTPGQHRLLLPWSGGADSTYALWRLLIDGFDVICVHVKLHNKFNRDPFEGRAVERSQRWLERQSLKGSFEVLTVGIDYGDVIWTRATRTIEICRPLAALATRRAAYRDISIIVATGIVDDGPISDNWKRSIHAMVEGAARKPMFLMRVQRHLEKKDIIADMPDDLYATTWSCNWPVRETGQPCQRCSTCRHVAQYRQVPKIRAVGVLPLRYQLDRPR